jgi:hypothetical protein
MFGEFRRFARPWQRPEIVHLLAEPESRRGPEDHDEIAAVAALKSIEIQDFRSSRILLRFMMYAFKVPLYAAKRALNSVKRQLGAVITAMLSKFPPTHLDSLPRMRFLHRQKTEVRFFWAARR